MIDFIGTDGRQYTGEVWSPGPIARSVWVLVDGHAFAVKLSAEPFFHRQFEWVTPHRAISAIHPAPSVQKAYIDDVKYAPKLSQKTWRELTADQTAGEQLELTA